MKIIFRNRKLNRNGFPNLISGVVLVFLFFQTPFAFAQGYESLPFDKDSNHSASYVCGSTNNPDGTGPDESMNQIKKQLIYELGHGTVSKIYRNTYHSLTSRMKENGYLQESLTGAYRGEFPRTIGGYVSLLMETEDYIRIQRSLEFVFESMIRNHLSKVPHVIDSLKISADGTVNQWFETEDQVDGRAHVVMAYARFCLKKNQPEFENKYYEIAKKEVMSFLDQPYFYYIYRSNFSCNAIHLVFNCALEHSREGRMWSVFDILTQSFVGAAAQSMMQLAERRNDTELYEYLKTRLEVLKDGVDKHLTRVVDGKKVYLEMRLPDGNWGQPFTGMGWLCYGPVAAQWEPIDRQILRNTINLLKQTLFIDDELDKNLKYLAAEYDEKGSVTKLVIGKAIGWDMEYCRQEGEYDKILEWFKFLNKYHADKPIYIESMFFKGGNWVQADCGNGEQSVWWCFAIARLRKDLGLPAVN